MKQIGSRGRWDERASCCPWCRQESRWLGWNDLIGIHVGLRARAGLPDHKGKVVNELEVGDLSGGC